MVLLVRVHKFEKFWRNKANVGGGNENSRSVEGFPSIPSRQTLICWPKNNKFSTTSSKNWNFETKDCRRNQNLIQNTLKSDYKCTKKIQVSSLGHIKKSYCFPSAEYWISDARVRFLYLSIIFSIRSNWDFWDRNNIKFSTYHEKYISIIEEGHKIG